MEKKSYPPVSCLLLMVSWGSFPTVLIPFSTDPCWQTRILPSFTFIRSPNYLLPSSIPFLSPLPPSHFALASGVLAVMESLASLCELLSLMRLLSHTAYQINRLHRPITTQTHQPRAPQRRTRAPPHCTGGRRLWLMGCDASKDSRAGDRGRGTDTEDRQLKRYTHLNISCEAGLLRWVIILLME